MSGSSRRRFLQVAATTGAAASFGGLDILKNLPRVLAQEAQLDTQRVQLGGGIEPLVQLLEETPREKLLEAVGERIREGTSYREVLAALLLAGVRNIQPRPSVGFKFHAVLVVNSAHLASLASPDEHRWLPIFWALDYFKDSQARDVREGNWTMRRRRRSGRAAAAPGAAGVHRSDGHLGRRPKADAATAGAGALGRRRTSSSNCSAATARAIFARSATRRSTSPTAWRTLECIGWQHAEPVLRSLAYALLTHEGDANPAKSDHAADRPGRHNAELGEKDSPKTGSTARSTTRRRATCSSTLRTAPSDEACDKVVELLQAGHLAAVDLGCAVRRLPASC